MSNRVSLRYVTSPRFRQYQYWLHRRIRCSMSFAHYYNNWKDAEVEWEIDAGYCLDRRDTNV